jgi:hypothetical protein
MGNTQTVRRRVGSSELSTNVDNFLGYPWNASRPCMWALDAGFPALVAVIVTATYEVKVD